MPKSYKQTTYEDIKSKAYYEKMLDLWKMYFKLKKFRMGGTGSLEMDKIILEQCGSWSIGQQLNLQVIELIYNELLSNDPLSADISKQQLYQVCYDIVYVLKEPFNNPINRVIKNLMDKHKWTPDKVIYKQH